ncbi:MAG: hypothetical protein VX054_01010 [Pseudomonadota bacterium]|nr:hypothetical protein [Pseudomonadota bacterium]
MYQFRKTSKINVIYSMLHEDEYGTIGATPKELAKAINSTEAHVRSLISELRIIFDRNDIYDNNTNKWIKWDIVFENGIYYINK